MVVSRRFVIASVLVVCVLLGILAIGTLDYDVSRQLVNEQSAWALFLNHFGEIPAYFGVVISAFLIYGSRMRGGRTRTVVQHLPALPLLVMLTFFVVWLPFQYFYEYSGYAGSSVSAVLQQGVTWLVWIQTALLVAVGLVLMNQLPREKMRALLRPAWLYIAVVVLSVLVVNLMKIGWARPRMRSIDTLEQFRYWYEISGPTTANELKSFPSGHTAVSFSIIAYAFFTGYFQRLRNWHVIGFGIVWGSLVALSRVVLGAHFLSDVVAGAYVTVVLFMVAGSMMNRKIQPS